LQVRVPRSIIDQVRCRETQCPVKQPISGCSHRQRLSSDLKREDLSCHNPINLLASTITRERTKRQEHIC
jgi:hypothetical protein